MQLNFDLLSSSLFAFPSLLDYPRPIQKNLCRFPISSPSKMAKTNSLVVLVFLFLTFVFSVVTIAMVGNVSEKKGRFVEIIFKREKEICLGFFEEN